MKIDASQFLAELFYSPAKVLAISLTHTPVKSRINQAMCCLVNGTALSCSACHISPAPQTLAHPSAGTARRQQHGIALAKQPDFRSTMLVDSQNTPCPKPWTHLAGATGE